MLKTGKQYLEGLRDGRVIYIGSERVDDVTTHPAFRGGAQSMAALYDLKADPGLRDVMSFEEGGERFSMYYLMPRSRADLERRMNAHRLIAEQTCGLFGRSPDHVSSFVTGFAMLPAAFDPIGPGYGDNIVGYYRHMRANDSYAAYAVLPPAGARNPEFYLQQNRPTPTLRVVDETDDGVVVSGLKMLATGAAYADELWIGNLLPIAPSQIKESITCAVPCNTPGVSLWSRKPFARDVRYAIDYPLSARLDESDMMVMCDNVKVPWERVFVHDNTEMSREVYTVTPSHCFGNHQSNVRFWAKMRLLTGVMGKVAQSSGIDKVPQVRDMLGRMAALEATIAGMVYGQIQDYEDWPGGPEGYVCFNRRIMYAALNWCTENHPAIIEMLRELTGGSVFQLPADASVMHDERLRKQFETYWETPEMDALSRMKLFRLAWDLIGSEFAGRHQQYEKFYAGPSFVVRSHSFREAPWETFHDLVDQVIDRNDVPEAPGRGTA